MENKQLAIIKSFSEYSSIQGLHYICQEKQTTFGKIFWSFIVVSMMTLGIYWSVQSYQSWQDQQVITTVKTTAFKVTNIEFPAITICGQGLNEDIIFAGFLKLAIRFLKQNGIKVGISPFKAVKLLKSVNYMVQNMTESDKNVSRNFYDYIINDKDGMRTRFYQKVIPGIVGVDKIKSLISFIQLLSSKNPDVSIKNMAMSQELPSQCRWQPICDQGFFYDQTSNWCYIVLNETYNFWNARSQCNSRRLSLPQFESDQEVQGIMTFLQSSSQGQENISFYLNAFGNPDDGYSFQEPNTSSELLATNSSFLKLINHQLDYHFCLLANFTQNNSYFELHSTLCKNKLNVVCRKPKNRKIRCQNTLNQLDLADPFYAGKIYNEMEEMKNRFKGLNLTTSFAAHFSMMWYSSLPCFDINGVTSASEGEKDLLKSCFWKGLKVSCAAIFDTFPTDQGTCCSFNMRAADKIFHESNFTRLVMQQQQDDTFSAFSDSDVPDQFKNNNEPKVQAGQDKGLIIILDAHNDLISRGSIDVDYQGFTGIITNTGNYPLTQQKGFHIKNGHYNLVAITGTKISADMEILQIEPQNRGCLFEEENYNLTIHKRYSMSNCFLECAISYAQNKMIEMGDIKKPCSPWYLPTPPGVQITCDPWEMVNFVQHFQNVPSSACEHCLPDCNTVLYESFRTTAPFRKCDFRNLGASTLCDTENPANLKPQAWARQVLNYYPNLTILETSKRSYNVDSVPDGPFNINDTYDAYQEDIAIVQFYFKDSTIIEFKTSPKQGWIEYISNVGGLLGLCIGLSIITIFEIVWLFLRILSSIVDSRKPLKK